MWKGDLEVQRQTTDLFVRGIFDSLEVLEDLLAHFRESCLHHPKELSVAAFIRDFPRDTNAAIVPWVNGKKIQREI